MTLSRLPPGGNTIPLKDMLRRPDPKEDGLFVQDFASHINADPRLCLPTDSGTSALYFALVGLKGGRDTESRNEVIVPAWCCPSVPQAVLDAGLQVRLCDLDPQSLEYDSASFREAVGPQTLAVILVHFFGIRPSRPSPDLVQGVALLRDCAQDMDFAGADEPGIPRFYSFGRGKALNAGHGGLLVFGEDGPWFEAARDFLALVTPERRASLKTPVKALALRVLGEPLPFGLLKRMPFLGIGKTEWQEGRAYGPLMPGFGTLGLAALRAHRESARDRKRFSRRLGALLGRAAQGPGVDGLYFLPRSLSGEAPLRFPVLVPHLSLRDRLLRTLEDGFGGVTRQYPAILPELPGAPAALGGNALGGNAGPGLNGKGIPSPADFPGARTLAAGILTLPVSGPVLARAEDFLLGLRQALEEVGLLPGSKRALCPLLSARLAAGSLAPLRWDKARTPLRQARLR